MNEFYIDSNQKLWNIWSPYNSKTNTTPLFWGCLKWNTKLVHPNCENVRMNSADASSGNSNHSIWPKAIKKSNKNIKKKSKIGMNLNWWKKYGDKQGSVVFKDKDYPCPTSTSHIPYSTCGVNKIVLYVSTLNQFECTCNTAQVHPSPCTITPKN